MRKLRKWERYVLFPKTKDSPLEGEIPLNIAQKEVKAHKAWQKPITFIRTLFGAYTTIFRTKTVTASGQHNPFFGNPSTALRVGFDSLPKNSRSAVEQQSKASRTRLEYVSKRSRRTLEQHPKESRTAVEDKFGYKSFFTNPNVQYANANALAVFKFLRDSICKHGIYKPKYAVSDCINRNDDPKSGISKHKCGIYKPKYAVSDCIGRNDNPKSGISKHKCGIYKPKYAVSDCISRNDNPKSGISKHKCGIYKPKYAVSDCIGRNDNPKSSIGKHIRSIYDSICRTYKRISGILVLKNVAYKPKCRKSERRYTSYKRICGIREHGSGISKRIPGESNRKKAQVLTNLAPSRDSVRYFVVICLVFNLRSLYQKATVSIRVTYQKYTLDLLKTYQRLTKKLPTRYKAVGNKLLAVYGDTTANVHAFSSVRVASVWRSRFLPSKGSAICCVSMLCFCVLFSEAQAQPAGERAVEGLGEIKSVQIGDNAENEHQYVKIERGTIPQYVRIKNVDYKARQILHYEPHADLERYPLFEYRALTEKIKPIADGAPVSQEIWDLPLRIVNDVFGRDSVTLRELAGAKIMVLDFWSRACKPCLESMDKWENLQTDNKEQLQVIGLMMDYDYKAVPMITNKGWNIPQIVGPEVYLLNYYFLATPVLGPSVWIKDGRYLGATAARNDNQQLLKLMLAGEFSEVPTDMQWKEEYQ